jgi:hypothetical protein
MSISKILSLVVAGIYLAVPLLAYLIEKDEEALKAFIVIIGFLVLPLACIWFGDEMGDWGGTMRLRAITSSSPGIFVVVMGWVILLLPVFIYFISTWTQKAFF